MFLSFSQYSTEVKLMFNLIFRVFFKCMNVYLLFLEISSNKHLESFFCVEVVFLFLKGPQFL